MGKRYTITLGLLVLLLSTCGLHAQPADGENEYRLAAVNPRFLAAPDTIDEDAGRGVWVVHDPDLDNDGLPEILVTEYSDGGRVFVFEVVGNDVLEHVWSSPKLEDGSAGGGSTPRSITAGDFDNNGRQEIVFQVGFSSKDSVDVANRGFYFYEWTGQDNDYGTEAIHKLTFESIDPGFNSVSVGKTENGLTIQDIDGDGKSELLFPPRSGNFAVTKLYILEVASGTFAGGDAVVVNEFTYEDMVKPPFLGGDGFLPVGTEIGDVDSDGFDEIIVYAWTTIGTGGGLGFIQIDGPDAYTPGSVLSIPGSAGLSANNNVKAKPIFTTVNDSPVLYLAGQVAGDVRKIWVVEGIVSDAFVSDVNFTELFEGVGIFGIWDMGDQDHPTASAGDGLDLYMAASGSRLIDIEYNGSGSVTDPNNYTTTEVFDLLSQYDFIDGLWDDVYARPGLDLDGDGNRDFVVSYKGSPSDSLGGELFIENTFNIFLFEWGDSTASKDLVTSVPRPHGLTIITPEDFQLQQNYPNPFNPATTITFALPIDKTISLKVYNSLGQEVSTLVDHQALTAGSHTVQWDATDNSGGPVASGVYFYRLVFGNFSKSKQMTLIR